MNLAIIKHTGVGATSKNYAFSLPEGVTLEKGTLVKAQTRMGVSYGELVCDSFEAEGAALDYILRSCGTSVKKMRPVTAVFLSLEMKQVQGAGKDVFAEIVRERDFAKRKLDDAMALLKEVNAERNALKQQVEQMRGYLKAAGVGD